MAEALDLDALQAALEAATPGPWQWDPDEPDTVWNGDPDWPEIITVTRWDRLTAREDASLIVAAVNALPALLAVARRAAAQEQALREKARELDDWLRTEIVTDNGFAEQIGATVLDNLLAVLDTHKEGTR